MLLLLPQQQLPAVQLHKACLLGEGRISDCLHWARLVFGNRSLLDLLGWNWLELQQFGSLVIGQLLTPPYVSSKCITQVCRDRIYMYGIPALWF
jgi:hypothetical protein